MRSCAPVDERGARDVAARVDRRRAAVGPPAEVEDPDPARPRFSASQSVVARMLRTGQPLIAGIIRPWSSPSMPDPEKLAAVRTAIPALAAGIYLNTGSVGPLPAETAAAMADIAAYERDVGRGPRRLLRRSSSAGWTRRGPASRRSSARTSPPVALTHADDRRDERGEPPARLAARRPGRDHDPRARRRPRSAVRPARRGTAPRSRSSTSATTATTTRTIAAFDAAITPGTRLVSLSHVLWTTGAVLPVARDRGARPRPRRARRRRRRPGRRRDPVPVRRPRRRRSTPCRPRSGCSARRGWARSWSTRARSSGSSPALGGWFSFEAADGTGRRALVARRPPVRGDRLPPAVGRRDGPLDRLAVDVRRARLRLPARAGDGRARPRRASPAIPGVTVLTPRHAMATLVTFRIAGWPAAGGARRAGLADLRDRPDDPEPRRAPDQRRLLHHGRGARPLRRGGRAARARTRPRRCRRGGRSTILGEG